MMSYVTRFRQQARRNGGFTLSELICVVAIIGIFSVGSIPWLEYQAARTETEKVMAELLRIHTEAVEFYNNNNNEGEWPSINELPEESSFSLSDEDNDKFEYKISVSYSSSDHFTQAIIEVVEAKYVYDDKEEEEHVLDTTSSFYNILHGKKITLYHELDPVFRCETDIPEFLAPPGCQNVSSSPFYYTLTLLKGGNGKGKVDFGGCRGGSVPLDCPDCKKVQFLKGSMVALAATPYDNSRFDHWKCHDKDSGNVVMDMDRECTAYFTLKEEYLDPWYRSTPVSGETLVFPDTQLYTQTSASLEISKAKSDDIQLESITLEGDDAGDFEILSPELPTLLDDSNSPLTIDIACTPSQKGLRKATLTLPIHTTDDTHTATLSYPLECKGLAANYFVSKPKDNTLNFGSRPVGKISDPQSIVIVTTAAYLPLEVSIDSITKDDSITEDHASDFIVTTPTEFTLSPVPPDTSTSQKITLRCIPSTGGARTAKLTLNTNDPENPTPEYTLICEGSKEDDGVPPPGDDGVNDDSVEAQVNKPIVIDVLANDEDRNLDIVYAGDNNQMCLGDGEGNFLCAEAGGTDSRKVALADIDGDTYPDAVFAGQPNHLCFGDGKGGFKSCQNIGDESLQGSAVALGKIDGDDYWDMVFANDGQLNLVCLSSESSCQSIESKALYTQDVDIGDLDGDGRLDDVVFSNRDYLKEVDDCDVTDPDTQCYYDAFPITLCLYNYDEKQQSNSFACTDYDRDFSFSSYKATSVLIEDLDPDNPIMDILVGSMNKVVACNLSKDFPCPEYPEAAIDISKMANTVMGLATVDIKNDGKLDVVLANQGGYDLICLDWTGNKFAPCYVIKTSYLSSMGGTSMDVAIGNINYGGKPDVVFAGGDNRVCLGNDSNRFFDDCRPVDDEVRFNQGVALGYLGFYTQSLKIAVAPRYGQATVNPTGTITYTPNISSQGDNPLAPDFNGTDTFVYQIEGKTATVTVNIIQDPKAVALTDFQATSTPQGILITWQTDAEIDNAGFHMWRAVKDEAGHYTQITQLTDQLIPAKADGLSGASYRYLDLSAQSGEVYYYGLVDIDTHGQSTLWDAFIDSASK